MYRIVTKTALKPTVILYEIEAPMVAKKAQPGQFIILRVDENGERIPITIHDYDREKGTVTIIVQTVGATTEKLSHKQQGDCLHDFVGPLGKPTETEGKKKVCVVGGGVGCAIAYPVLKKFHDCGAEVHAVVGFKNKDVVILEDKFRAVSSVLKVCTDDGSYGQKGLVTEALKELLDAGNVYDEIFAIGPMVMMKFVSKTTEPYGVPTTVSMSPIMIDGTGMCGGCRLCGRVCPQESQCEMHCVRGKKGEAVGIGRLERFVADWHNAHSTEAPEKPQSNGHKVAVVGSGPAGLTCAGDLAKKGYDVTVYEALHLAGGVLVYGIPEFRLPKTIVQKEVDGLKAMGVKVETNIVVGRTITIDELMEENGFEAVFVGSGAGLPMFMHIPGENLKGVYSANEFLTRINLMKAYKPDSDTPIMDLKGKKVAVVGGGNVAMDAARCSKRLGAEVYVVYRRGMEELPARHEEVEHAIEEGVIFKTLNNPVQINGDEQDCVKSMTCIEMELGEPDASGRRRPVEKQGSEFDLPVDAVIMSLGTTPNPLIKATTKGLEVNKKGCIIVNEDGLTSREGVYAGGDAVTGAATVILAMGAGKLGAKSIDEFLSAK